MGRKALYGLRNVSGVRAARQWLGWSLTETAEKLGVSRGLVIDWQSGRRKMPHEKAKQIGQMIIDQLAQLTRRDNIGLMLEANSPMQIVILAQCTECHEWFALRHAGHKRCEQCRLQRRRGD